MAGTETKVRFIPPMLLLRRERLPEGAEWLYELKLDGYRALAIKTEAKYVCGRATTMTSTLDIQALSKL